MSEFDETVYSDENTDQENESVESTQEEEVFTSAEKAKLLAMIERKNKQLEAFKSKSETAPVAKEEKQTTADVLSKDELILYAKGLDDNQIELAKKVAQIEGVSVREAVNTDYFKALEKIQKDKIESEKANIQSSNRSPKAPEKKSFDTPELSKEEHMKLFKEKFGR